MSNSKYNSTDFYKVPPNINVEIPTKLIHKNVEKEDVHQTFSVERKHPVHIVDLPSEALSMTIGGLDAGVGKSSNRHRHTYETILYILEGRGYTQVEDEKVEWEAGDAVYVPSWAWHNHVNLDPNKPARYLACENAPMLQNIGLALREEKND